MRGPAVMGVVWEAVDVSFAVLSLQVEQFHLRVKAPLCFFEILVLDSFSLKLADLLAGHGGGGRPTSGFDVRQQRRQVGPKKKQVKVETDGDGQEAIDTTEQDGKACTYSNQTASVCRAGPRGETCCV